MLSREGSARTFRQNTLLALTLSGVAGHVNAVGFFTLGAHSSHVTGFVARTGELVSLGRFELAATMLGLVGTFLLGAMTATGLIEIRRRHGAPYASALAVETFALAIFAVWSASVVGTEEPPTFALLGLLTFAMGLQNAMVTKISGAVIRTTHLTGVVTDFGIEVVRLATWSRHKLQGMSLSERVRRLPLLAGDEEVRRAWLHAAIFGAFLAGAVVGSWLHLRAGAWSMALPCAVLALLVGWDGLAGSRRSAVPAQLVDTDPPPTGD